jgi:hypothetical protein
MKASAQRLPNGDSIEGKETLAYAGLLAKAHDEGLKSVQTQLLVCPNDENGRLCIVKATVEVERGHFEGIGDADPSSVEAFLAPHLIRVAETRAKARALRDAVNCGVVSCEELDGGRPGPGFSDPGSGAQASSRGRGRPSAGRSIPPRGNGQDRPSQGGNGSQEPMSEAQRRYLFRLLAGKGYQGKTAEDYLYAEFEVRALSQVTRAQASNLIDQLLQSSPQGEGGGAPGHQR